MRIEKRKARYQPNLVSSFIAAFVGSGAIEGACVKFAMFDGSTRLLHLEPKWFLALHQCVEYYSGLHYYGSDLQRASEEPSFLASLPKRHPVRTMKDEKPRLTQDEYQVAKERFSVASLQVVDEGSILRLECTYRNGCCRVETLPAYIAMNLCSSLQASLDLSGLMAAEPGGTA